MPNGENKKLNFVAKVWDAKANNGVGAYRPIYIAPDATTTVQGDVFLSDDANANLNAETGMTAATPKAVNDVLSTANEKLDKFVTSSQSVAGPVSFAETTTFSKQIVGNGGFKGDVVGNASTASTLKTSRTVTLDAGGAASSASFNGSSDIAISLSQVDAGIVSKGTLPLSVIPQAALERLVKVTNQAARFKLTTSEVQLGDSVLQTDTNIMYIVVDTANLGNANGYQEYKAGTAASADTATKLTNSRNFSLTGEVTASAVAFNGTGNVALATTITDNAIVTSKIKDGNVTSAKVDFNYAGSSSKGGAATSALTATQLTTARNFSLSGAVIANAVAFDGTENVALATALTDGVVTTAKLADASNSTVTTGVTSNKIENGAITTAKIANSQITTAKIANSQVTTAKLADASNSSSSPTGVTNAKIENGAITTTKITDYAVTLAKLDTGFGVVTSGSSVPAATLDSRYKLYALTETSDDVTSLSAVYIRI